MSCKVNADLPGCQRKNPFIEQMEGESVYKKAVSNPTTIFRFRPITHRFEPATG